MVQIPPEVLSPYYSERPKSERPNTEQRRNPNKFLFGMNVFGFRSFGPKTLLFGLKFY